MRRAAARAFVVGAVLLLGCATEDRPPTLRLSTISSATGRSSRRPAIVPAFFLLIGWLLIQPLFIESQVTEMIPDAAIAEGSSRSLVMSDVRRVADGPLRNSVCIGSET